MKQEVKRIISQLKKGEIGLRDIPDEYRSNHDIIQAERMLELRVVIRSGYDVINDSFFVEEKEHNRIEKDKDEEILWRNGQQLFDDFNTYFAYLNGDIYNNACYYLMSPQKITQDVDQNKLYQKQSFIEDTIDNYGLVAKDSDYLDGEKRKKQFISWLKKFDSCTDVVEFKKTAAAYKKSKICSELVSLSNPWNNSKFSWYDHTKYNDCFIWYFLNTNTNNKQRIDIVMTYLSELTCVASVVRELCAVFNPQEIAEAYNCSASFSEAGNKKQNLRLRNFAKAIETGMIAYDSTRAFFDELTHCYWEEKRYNILDGKYTHNQNMGDHFSTYKIFTTFEDFISYRNGNFSNTDLSKNIELNLDVSKFIVDSSTLLPANDEQKLNYVVRKYYRNGKYYVRQAWYDQNDNEVKHYEHKFDYFCDFVAFLNGDLSNADLISCDGLEHIVPTDKINFQNAFITSNISQKWGVAYERLKINAPAENTFSFSEQNETETAMVLQSSRDLIVNEDGYLQNYEPYDSITKRIYYISDIHLFHLLKNREVKSKSDVIKTIREVVSTIIKESDRDSIILINGDTSLNFSIFKLFASELGRYYRTVIFTIGNHDLWSCPDDTIDQLAEKYRTLLQENGMYLLNNEILYFDEFWETPKRISEDEINHLSEEALRNRTKTAKLILFGGTGFTGYNQLYNANFGLYRYNNTIGCNHDIELKETQRFEALYKKVASALHDKSVVIMTHMPLPDWYEPAWKHRSNDYSQEDQGEVEYRTDHPEDNVGTYSVYQPGFIYVSGHTHKNYFYDDGTIRIYADNQFGYHKNTPGAWPRLKYFEVDKTVDPFVDYVDGIYEITADEYRSFYRCKNINMDFNRESNIIHMLKKNGHYCFIHESKNKNLSMMNGGALRGLDCKDINYYYENMDLVVSIIKNPLDKYTEYQKQVSEDIKKLGGDGTIHGCIVDIDFYNHVYVNPNDGTVTGYWASDIIHKLIYPTIPALLEAQCPILFATYKKMLDGKRKSNLPAISQQNSQLALMPVPYLDTDIYKASRQIKKMQKLDADILSTWPDKLPQNNLLTE